MLVHQQVGGSGCEFGKRHVIHTKGGVVSIGKKDTPLTEKEPQSTFKHSRPRIQRALINAQQGPKRLDYPLEQQYPLQQFPQQLPTRPVLPYQRPHLVQQRPQTRLLLPKQRTFQSLQEQEKHLEYDYPSRREYVYPLDVKREWDGRGVQRDGEGGVKRE